MGPITGYGKLRRWLRGPQTRVGCRSWQGFGFDQHDLNGGDQTWASLSPEFTSPAPGTQETALTGGWLAQLVVRDA